VSVTAIVQNEIFPALEESLIGGLPFGPNNANEALLRWIRSYSDFPQVSILERLYYLDDG
jgi:hypothetical protein